MNQNWPVRPVIFEINTWPWLRELGRRLDRPVALGDVPPSEWDAVAALGVDAVWLMGVWERSPEGRDIALANAGFRAEWDRVLPGWTPDDVAGSPYCVRRYVVDENLGGPTGLAAAREELARRGLRLVLDFVPNHVAPDHPWIDEFPDYFVHGSYGDLVRDPQTYLSTTQGIVARGRDPYFPAWPDVLQLNAFSAGLRRAAAQTLLDIGAQCDGVRCDMAMLMLNDVFARTWPAAGERPATEYWADVIGAVRRKLPRMLFVAEAYWDLEWNLQQLGFDYCYDKRLYDRLVHEGGESVRGHLGAGLDYQDRLIRFLENHDEPRAAAEFPPDRLRAAAVAALTLPGALLIHEGQLEGRRVKLPVFLARRPEEPGDEALRAFHLRLLAARRELRGGAWQLCERTGWPDNPSFRNLLAWGWRSEEWLHLVVVNLSGRPAQARVRLPWPELAGEEWQLEDLLDGQAYGRSGAELLDPGLYVDLPPWGAHLFRI